MTDDVQDVQEWLENNGPLFCPRCGAPAQVELLDTDRQPRECLRCDCGEAMEFEHPPFGAVLPLMGVGFRMARHQSLAPWQAAPSGVRRWPRLARLVARPPRQIMVRWTWKGWQPPESLN